MLSRQLSATKYQTVVISPRSYFVFTPLLNSTAVGTLEFRTALEPIRNRRYPNVEFMQAWADDVNFDKKIVRVEESVIDVRQASAMAGDRYGDHTKGEERVEKQKKSKQGRIWDVQYDKLVVAVGCYSQTFGTKGVKENAFFLKDVGDARKIRKRILECFEIASLPTTNDQLKRQLLHFAVVGGGPTGMEFSAELSDLVHDDLLKLYPNVKDFVQITVYDVAPQVLSMFDERLAKYAMETFRRQDIQIKTEHHVEELRPGLPHRDGEDISNVSDTEGCFTLKLKEEGEIGVGMCVWSTGNMMNPFVQKAMEKCYHFPENSASIASGQKAVSHNDEWMIKKDSKTGALLVDDHLRVQLHTRQSSEEENKDKEQESAPNGTAIVRDVFALGDNAMLENVSLPATAQTANQQAIWLGKHLNKGDIETERFTFKNMGIMTYLGDAKGLVQTGGNSGIQGRTAWLIWRGAYLTMSVSWRNKVLIPVYWYVVVHHSSAPLCADK